jgi:hypothetical protein
VHKRLIWVVLVVALGTGFAVGCGSSDDTTAVSLTKAEFIQQGNALCKERETARNEEIEARFAELEPGDKLSDSEQAQMVEAIIIPSYEKTISDIESLGVPEGEEPEVEQILTAMEKARKELEVDPEGAVFTTVMFNPPNKLARAYGLNSCAF